MRILIVDDEQSTKRSIKKIVSRHDQFSIVGEADDGKQALQLFQQIKPEIIFTDICMPIMDGLQLAEEVRAKDEYCTLVILSGYNDFAYAQKAIQHGVTEYLLKPVNAEDVSKVLEKIWHANVHKMKNVHDTAQTFIVNIQLLDRLMEQIWQLNESEVQQIVMQIHQTVEQESPIQQKEQWVRMIAYLKRKISEKNPDIFDNVNEKIEENVLDTFHIWMEKIKEIRHWGHFNIMKEALNFIHDNYYRTDFTLQMVVQKIGISSSYFSRMFKSQQGISFTEYVMRLKMEKAAELLNLQIKAYEVAMRVGYSDYSHFSKIFKKYYQLSPSQFQENS